MDTSKWSDVMGEAVALSAPNPVQPHFLEYTFNLLFAEVLLKSLLFLVFEDRQSILLIHFHTL